MKATAAAVKKLYGGRKPSFGWADFKAKLVRAGIINSTAQDVPAEWQEAFKRAAGK